MNECCYTCGATILFPQTECLFCQLWGSTIEAGGNIDDIDTIVRRELDVIAHDSSDLQKRATNRRGSRKIGFNV